MIYFDWDLAKAETNLQKHGVRFDAEMEIFDDPFAISEMDRIVEGEQRWKVVGVGGNAVLVAAYTLVAVDEAEYVRIISARKAEKKELRKYERQKLH